MNTNVLVSVFCGSPLLFDFKGKDTKRTTLKTYRSMKPQIGSKSSPIINSPHQGRRIVSEHHPRKLSAYGRSCGIDPLQPPWLSYFKAKRLEEVEEMKGAYSRHTFQGEILEAFFHHKPLHGWLVSLKGSATLSWIGPLKTYLKTYDD